MNKNINELTACILNRRRHKKVIEELNNLKVNTKLISDGDVSGALLVSNKKFNIDIFLGIGGGPEGFWLLQRLMLAGVFFRADLFLTQIIVWRELKKWVLKI